MAAWKALDLLAISWYIMVCVQKQYIAVANGNGHTCASPIDSCLSEWAL